MAAGKLGTARVAANTTEVLYEVPEGLVAVIGVHLCNVDTIEATVSIDLTTDPNDIAQPEDRVLSEFPLYQNRIHMIEKLVLSAGEKVMVTSAGAAVTARVFGFEELAREPA